MDEERKTAYFWWFLCAKGCSREAITLTPVPHPEWSTDGCPTCGAAYAGQVVPAPKVA